MSIPIEWASLDEIRKLMALYSIAFNRHVEWALRAGTWSKAKAHVALYETLRTELPGMPSGLLQCARDCALEAVKAGKLQTKPQRKPESSIRYDRRTCALRGRKLTFSTTGKRVSILINVPAYFEPLLEGKFQGMTLGFRKRKLWANLIFSAPDPEQNTGKSLIGIDRGIRNSVALSTGQIFSSSRIRASQRRHLHNRRTAQAKGTPSSRRRLKLMAGKEKRFSRDVNHVLSKKVAAIPCDGFALEDLTGIRKTKSRGKRFNKKLSSWPFHQFELFLSYKAFALGKSVLKVDPRYTSQRCNRCKHIDKTSRNKSRYSCFQCGYKEHSDVNAALNIRDLGILSRLSKRAVGQGAVNHPYATRKLAVASSSPRGRSS